jgi:predicted metal-dependent hydrolase
MWGSCGQDRQIHLNWHLIFAPRPVFEYAVVHELCHLKHRNHEPEFWQLVGSILPDWQSRKDWLDKNENMLGWEKVGPVTSPLT